MNLYGAPTLRLSRKMADRKIPPAVYAQIFRWPDVFRADLRSFSLFIGEYNAKFTKSVCRQCAIKSGIDLQVYVNPYRNERKSF